MPRRGKKGTSGKQCVETETEISSTPAQKGKKRCGPSPPPSADMDSPAKHTRSMQQEQPSSPVKKRPCSPVKESEMEFKARKSVCRSLTQNEEDDLVNWLRENAFLYDKSSAEFKFKDKKSRAWEAKETELGLKPGDLSSIWYPNMRTQFSKIVKIPSKSGSGAAERTARQQWILDSFGFLRPYLIQLRMQRGSKFAEKRKSLAPMETDDDDAASDSSLPLDSTANGSRPKAARVLSSLTSELEYVRGAITGVQDAAAHTGQFLVHLMRQMDQQRMHLFVTRVTRLALDFVDESQEEKRRLTAQDAARQAAQQTGDSEFVVPTLPPKTLPTNKRRAPPSASFGLAEQQQQFHQQQRLQQDFQLATNIAAAAPPANLTPQLKYYAHLQPPNVQPVFMQQPLCSSSFTNATVTSTPTASIIRQAMNIASLSNASFNLNQQPFDANSDGFQDLHNENE